MCQLLQLRSACLLLALFTHSPSNHRSQIVTVPNRPQAFKSQGQTQLGGLPLVFLGCGRRRGTQHAAVITMENDDCACYAGLSDKTSLILLAALWAGPGLGEASEAPRVQI